MTSQEPSSGGPVLPDCTPQRPNVRLGSGQQGTQFPTLGLLTCLPLHQRAGGPPAGHVYLSSSHIARRTRTIRDLTQQGFCENSMSVYVYKELGPW